MQKRPPTLENQSTDNVRGTRGLRSFEGIITATPTPLRPDGVVDEQSVTELATFLIDAGSDGLAPTGGTGEFTALSSVQRRVMVASTVAAAKKRVPVIPGILSPGLADTLATGREFLAEGADALLVVTPYYSRPTQDGILDYYKCLSDKLDADLILYEIPYRTGISLEPETVSRLADTTRIVAMKACNQDLSQQMRVVEAAGSKISILSGEEAVFPLHVAMGARGGLLATSCLFPKLWASVYRLARSGAFGRALALHARMRVAIDALFSEHNPGPLKAALAQIGRPAGEVLPPLRAASEGLVRHLQSVLPPILELEKTCDLRSAA
jgi:4-hydroxy-tetrahydrodipicolinate synthase